MAPGDPMLNKSIDDYYHDSGKDYELESFDKESLAEIRKLLKEDGYKDPIKLRDHMEYVESLITRLLRIIQDEDKQGLMNMSLKRDFAKVKELYDTMSRLLDRLEGTE